MINLFIQIERIFSAKMAQEIEVELRKIAPIKCVIPRGSEIEVKCADQKAAIAFRDRCFLVAQLLEKYWFDWANISWSSNNKSIFRAYKIPAWLTHLDEIQSNEAQEILEEIESKLIKIADFRGIQLHCNIITLRCFNKNAAIKFRNNWQLVSDIVRKHQIKSVRVFWHDFDTPLDIPVIPKRNLD